MAALLDWRARLVARREERRLAAERKAEVERIAAELAQRMAMAPERYRWSAALLTAAVRGWHTRYLLRKEADRLRRASAAAPVKQGVAHAARPGQGVQGGGRWRRAAVGDGGGNEDDWEDERREGKERVAVGVG